ncbi:hypothetical protein FOIG_16768 [Fusarium odoratissimum NRRL 54006]|uniref:Uncharacterized protein n=1 Tax=Fusarium odoratissimum (strain NRRL 54006) TaxID=1089451 RepID=X0IM37_FUSO5|nr:uncharacterized protein FOIG_16768 [Fusarium odoratissimum NRRL 54006]EXL89953.1 hypothetical protein FOIG_16768 [Fusarium odoratissimum NRRL 54006]
MSTTFTYVSTGCIGPMTYLLELLLTENMSKVVSHTTVPMS